MTKRSMDPYRVSYHTTTMDVLRFQTDLESVFYIQWPHHAYPYRILLVMEKGFIVAAVHTLFMHYILICNHLEWRWLFSPFRYILIQSVYFFFCLNYKHLWWWIIFRNDRRVHRFILCQNYMMFPLVLPPPSYEAVNCFICGRRRVAVARYRIICLVLIHLDDIWYPEYPTLGIISHRPKIYFPINNLMWYDAVFM